MYWILLPHTTPVSLLDLGYTTYMNKKENIQRDALPETKFLISAGLTEEGELIGSHFPPLARTPLEHSCISTMRMELSFAMGGMEGYTFAIGELLLITATCS